MTLVEHVPGSWPISDFAAQFGILENQTLMCSGTSAAVRYCGVAS